MKQMNTLEKIEILKHALKNARDPQEAMSIQFEINRLVDLINKIL